MSYDNTNRGTLGRNRNKQKDTHPEYSGSINVEGKEYWLSGWVKEKDGRKFFSLSVKPKEAKQESQATSSQEDDNDVPF